MQREQFINFMGETDFSIHLPQENDFEDIQETKYIKSLKKAKTLTDVYNAIYRLEKSIQLHYGETEDRANRLGAIKAVKKTWDIYTYIKKIQNITYGEYWTYIRTKMKREYGQLIIDVPFTLEPKKMSRKDASVYYTNKINDYWDLSNKYKGKLRNQTTALRVSKDCLNNYWSSKEEYRGKLR